MKVKKVCFCLILDKIENALPASLILVVRRELHRSLYSNQYELYVASAAHPVYYLDHSSNIEKTFKYSARGNIDCIGRLR